MGKVLLFAGGVMKILEKWKEDTARIQESGTGNTEPLEDILKEKGLFFLYDQIQIQEKLKELGKPELIGRVGSMITMVDKEEGEASWWVIRSSRPGLQDTVTRIR